MLSRNLEESLHRAIGLARERRHEYATLEHLLVALTDDRDALAVMRACAVDVGKLRAELVFDIFDVDGNGVLDREEMHDMLRTVGLRGVHMIENLFDPYLDPGDVGMAVNFEAVRHYDEIEQDAELAVARADVNDDGLVTREEYLAWIEDHAVMRQYIEIPNLLFGAVR